MMGFQDRHGYFCFNIAKGSCFRQAAEIVNSTSSLQQCTIEERDNSTVGTSCFVAVVVGFKRISFDTSLS